MRNRMLFSACLFVFAASILTASMLMAASGRLTVEVTDEDGKALSRVRVVVTVPATDRVYERATTKRGSRVFQGLPSGEVIVRFELEGYQIYETNALIQSGGDARVEARLVRLAPVSAEKSGAAAAVAAYNEAVAKYKARDLEAAAALLESALEKDPDLAPARDLARRVASEELYFRVIDKINQGDDAGAGELLEELLEGDPDFSPAIYQRGLIHLQSGDTASAVADLEHYLELAPNGEFAEDARSMVEALKS